MKLIILVLATALCALVGHARVHRLKLDTLREDEALTATPLEVTFQQSYKEHGSSHQNQRHLAWQDAPDESPGSHLAYDHSTVEANGGVRHVPVSNLMGSQFYATIAVGTPPVEFRMALDTGSANSWILSSQCHSSSCWLHNKYNHTRSLTYQANGTEIRLPYSNTLIKGFVSQDDMILDTVIIEHQDFAEITDGLVQGYDASLDGSFGLAFDDISINNLVPPLYNMLAQDSLDEPVFAFRLGSSEQDTGEATFGGIDDTAYTGRLRYFPVKKLGLWEIELEQATLGDLTLGPVNTGAAFVSGTSSIVMPSKFAYIYNKQIGATKRFADIHYTVSCASVQDLPELSFVFGGNTYSLTGQDYIRRIGGLCVSPFVGNDLIRSGPPVWIIGDVFMRKYYTVFDFARREIGLATSRTSKEL